MKIKGVYLGEKQIRPAKGWRPGENTVAYFPFETDATDHSGNGITLSNLGSKQTLGYKFTSNSNFSRNLNTARFVSLRCKVISGRGGGSAQVAIIMYGGMCYNLNHLQSDFRNTIQFGNGSSRRKQSTGMSANQRYHLAWSYNGTMAVMYVNGVKTILVNSTSYYSGVNADALVTGSGYDIDLSKVIFEDRVRTDEEVSDYYNKTKSDYGIS